MEWRFPDFSKPVIGLTFYLGFDIYFLGGGGGGGDDVKVWLIL